MKKNVVDKNILFTFAGETYLKSYTMKKTLLLSVFLLAQAVFVFGQNLQLFVKEGTTYVPVNTEQLVKIQAEDLNNELASVEYFVHNNSNAPISVRAKRTNVSVLEGTISYMCFGLCYMPSADIVPIPAKDPIVIPANTTLSDTELFSAHYSPLGQEGAALISYKFYNVDDENDAVTLNVEFYAGPKVGINEVDNTAKLSAYPNPTTGQIMIDYTIKEQANAALVIYNINGQQVYIQALDAAQASVNISLEDMPKGVYMYRIEAPNYQSLSRKIVLQ